LASAFIVLKKKQEAMIQSPALTLALAHAAPFAPVPSGAVSAAASLPGGFDPGPLCVRILSPF
jgi:hypothetical protein